jgi:hypothetical protein
MISSKIGDPQVQGFALKDFNSTKLNLSPDMEHAVVVSNKNKSLSMNDYPSRFGVYDNI